MPGEHVHLGERDEEHRVTVQSEEVGSRRGRCRARASVPTPPGRPTHAAASALPIAFISLYAKNRDRLVFYGKDGIKWQLQSVAPVEPIGIVARLFRPLRQVPVSVDFQSRGAYALDELRDDLRSAVEADDDVLAQFHSHEEILHWLAKAQSFARIFNLYRFITKDFTPYAADDGDRGEGAAPRRRRPTARGGTPQVET